MSSTRREFLQVAGAGVALATFLRGGSAFAADSDTVTIAYNVNLPAWDPTTGPSAVNPTIQAIYRSVFDQYIGQEPNLEFVPNILTDWGWNDDKTRVWMTVRDGVKWQDGSDLTPEDVVWSLKRAGDPDGGNPIQFVWSTIGDFTIDGNRVEAKVKSYEPTLFKWMAFLTGYVLPKAYYEKVGAQGFEKKPIGSGPYMVEEFQSNGFLRLKRNPHYWGDKPAFETVIFKFVTDATSRVAEVESGSSDITLQIPYEEYDRLTSGGKFSGSCEPVSDIGMIFINDVKPLLDKNVRLAATYAVDKQAIIDRLLRGYGVAIDTLEAPEYLAYDPSIKVPHDPEKAKELLAKSGFSPDNPVKVTIQTTRGYMPRDYEMIQAIAGMWSKVGIEANIEVYEIAKHYELRAADKLAPFAFYNWGNAIADPATSTGFAMFGPSPHSVWDTDDLDQKIAPLWNEKDEKKRIAGWKDVDRYIAEQGYVLPLLQYAQPIVYRKGLKVTPNKSEALEAKLIDRTVD
ncbi:ABC transporter substrate-binding protein [Pararhizobium mangrovi]|uniref:Peptide ABC transporter substrate-binding protein n=1 Tax=Pararhizobium mangrovi TaxID=2590452 RepID=A0A506UA03_9HYPH|nr:ABC transporter substrate-binding protein [Pararhizobium mangrovi]TPW30186.1 peptide ABC transporter substrate-binding protein [Pararhizobium mangrovi]